MVGKTVRIAKRKVRSLNLTFLTLYHMCIGLSIEPKAASDIIKIILLFILLLYINYIPVYCVYLKYLFEFL